MPFHHASVVYMIENVHFMCYLVYRTILNSEYVLKCLSQSKSNGLMTELLQFTL